MPRLPVPGADNGHWGGILNDFLSVEHDADGTLKADGSLAAKEPVIPAGTNDQYFRGDKTFQTLDKAAVGLANVDNTSDSDKPVSSAVSSALALKADATSPTFSGTTTVSGPLVSTAGGAMGEGTQVVVSDLYVQSRGNNLVTNGAGQLGNNYNFSAFTFDAAETHAGFGSFKVNVSHTSRSSNEKIPVDVTRRYRLVGWGKSGDVDGSNYNPANIQYLGVALYDIDGRSIGAENSTKYAGSTDTTLAAPLNPGDTTMTLTSAAGWYNGASIAATQFCWYGYTNAKGYTYPDYTYTRNMSANYGSNITLGTWLAGGVSGNVITLRVPWEGPTLAAGTKVRNNLFGTTYKYIAASAVNVPNTWTRYEGFIGPADGSALESTVQFRAGTAYVSLLFLVNYHSAADNNVRWSDLWLSELSSANLETASTTQAGTVSLSNQSMGTGEKYFGSKVGIGNTAPAVALDVTGEIRASTAGTNATSVVTVGGSQTLTSKTLTSPVISNAYVNKTSNYTITSTDSCVTADATSGAFTITLPTAVGKTGQSFTIKRTNSGSNLVTVATTSSQTIDGVTTWPLTSQNATITVVSDGANWQLLQGYRNSVDVQSWVASGTTNTAGTWVKPPGARLVQITTCSGGGGGGSGRRGAAGTVRCGGGGGGAGAVVYITVPASDLGSTEAIQAGGGGAGGAAVTTDDTNGNPGQTGGYSVFRSAGFTKIAGHSAAGGGTNASGTGGAAFATSSVGGNGGAGGSASTTGGNGGGSGAGGSGGASGGGAGGGISATDVEGTGGSAANHNGLVAGAGGAAGGGTGGTVAAVGGTLPSVGGGGGGASKTSAGGSGGNGATNGFGGGGGGGGASLNGFNSGAGGNGSPGYVIVTTYC